MSPYIGMSSPLILANHTEQVIVTRVKQHALLLLFLLPVWCITVGNQDITLTTVPTGHRMATNSLASTLYKGAF